MFDFRKFKTPHLFPARHFATVSGLFAFATFILCLLQMIPTHAWINAIAISVATGFFSAVLGTVATATTRSRFNLIQTGRVIQWLGFWLATSLWVGVFSRLFADSASVASSFVNGGIVFASSFAFAYSIKEIPWRGRTWLPMKRKH